MTMTEKKTRQRALRYQVWSETPTGRLLLIAEDSAKARAVAFARAHGRETWMRKNTLWVFDLRTEEWIAHQPPRVKT